MTDYRTTLEGVTAEGLAGFFVGWPSPPAPARLLAALRGSSHVVIAWEDDGIVGFVNAVSDGSLSAYLPLLEVRPAMQRRGIGGELVARMLAQLQGFYSVDLLCDPELLPFYERAGGRPLHGAGWRDPEAS